MSGMFDVLHGRVTEAQLFTKLKASDVHLDEDLRNLDNALDDFSKAEQWDMTDFHTRKLVERFQLIKKQFDLVKQIVESARY